MFIYENPNPDSIKFNKMCKNSVDPRSSEFLLIKYPLVLTVILATYHYGVNMGVEYMRT